MFSVLRDKRELNRCGGTHITPVIPSIGERDRMKWKKKVKKKLQSHYGRKKRIRNNITNSPHNPNMPIK